VKQNLESEQAAQRNQEVSKNVTELDAISKAAGKMQDGLSSSMPNLPAGAQDFVAFLKRYMFELIGLIAVVAAILVSISLLREKRRQQHKADDDDTDLDFKSGSDPSPDKPQDMKIDFDLDLPPLARRQALLRLCLLSTPLLSTRLTDKLRRPPRCPTQTL
jgi:hypothetical protein